MNKKRLIPFRWLPASIGLVGSAYDEAEAHYNYSGEDLERHLVKIRLKDDDIARKRELLKLDLKYDKVDEYTFDIEDNILLAGGPLSDKKKLDIDLRHGKIDSYYHALKVALLTYPDEDSIEYKIAILDADFEHNKITRPAYEKAVANLKHEPWVGVIDNGFSPEEGVNGLYFELDWNLYWIQFLRQNGYTGFDDDIIEQWFSDVCRSQAGENLPDPNAPIPFNSGVAFRNSQ